MTAMGSEYEGRMSAPTDESGSRASYGADSVGRGTGGAAPDNRAFPGLRRGRGNGAGVRTHGTGVRAHGAGEGWLQGERSYLLPLAALAFGLGIWLAPRVTAGLWPLGLLAVAAVAAGMLYALRQPLRWVCLPLLLMLGLLWAQAWLNGPRPETGAYGQVTATVYGEPTERSGGRMALTLCHVVLDGVPQPGKAACTLTPESSADVGRLFDGAALRFAGTVYDPPGKENEYDFDYSLWLAQNGIGYGITGVRDIAVLNTPETAPWASYASRVRSYLSERLRLAVGDTYALATAMLLGDRSAMAEEDQEAFESAGVAHLMSVSGLHVGLLAAGLLWLLNALTVRKAARLPVLGSFLLCYCILTGFSAATVRAAVMLMLYQGAKVAGRKPSALITLSAAALLVLLLNPLQLFSAGFVLSFAAMAGMLVLYPRLASAFRRRTPSQKPRAKRGGRDAVLRRIERYMGRPSDVLAVSLAAQIGVLLPTAAYFHRLPLYGIVFNLLTVPLAGLLVPLYAITLLVSALPWVGGFASRALGFAAGLGNQALLWIVGLSAKLPYAQVRVAAPNLWAYAGLLAVLAAVSRHVRASVARRALAAGLCVAIACAGAYACRPAGVRYHQFAVGQGDAALIVDGDATVAIDVGPYGGELAARLLAEGRDLDALIITHLHSDHAQGLETLLEEGIGIRKIYLPQGAQTGMDEESMALLSLVFQSGAPVAELSAGDSLTFHDVRMDVLWLIKGHTRAGIDPNDRSLAALIHLGQLRILTMGDNGSLYEQYFTVPCDVLKVGHHGSDGGTTERFLAVADPTFALVTCKADAALPGEDTLARLYSRGVRVLRTDRTGEIVVSDNGGNNTLSTFNAGGLNEP